jgi:hypothetical protein
MKRIINILKEHSGSQMMLGGFVAIGLCVVTLIIIEGAHLNDVSKAVRDAVQDAVTTSCTENYARVYNGIREGYSGGYTLEKGGSWSATIDPGDVYDKLDNVLGTRKEGDKHVKYVDGKEAFTLSGLTVQMTNAPFAPENADHAGKLTGIAYVNVSVPMGFNWGVPPMQLSLKVKAGYISKF